MTNYGGRHDGNVGHRGERATEELGWSRRPEMGPLCFRVFLEDTVHPNASSSGGGGKPEWPQGTWDGDTGGKRKPGERERVRA